MQTDVLHVGMSFFMPNMKGKQTMSKMKATDKQAMEILKKLDELIRIARSIKHTFAGRSPARPESIMKQGSRWPERRRSKP